MQAQSTVALALRQGPRGTDALRSALPAYLPTSLCMAVLLSWFCHVPCLPYKLLQAPWRLLLLVPAYLPVHGSAAVLVLVHVPACLTRLSQAPWRLLLLVPAYLPVHGSAAVLVLVHVPAYLPMRARAAVLVLVHVPCLPYKITAGALAPASASTCLPAYACTCCCLGSASASTCLPACAWQCCCLGSGACALPAL
jgi:hypothetical protein